MVKQRSGFVVDGQIESRGGWGMGRVCATQSEGAQEPSRGVTGRSHCFLRCESLSHCRQVISKPFLLTLREWNINLESARDSSEADGSSDRFFEPSSQPPRLTARGSAEIRSDDKLLTAFRYTENSKRTA